MSFYGTPLKHGKGVNKPFRSPLIKTDPNQDRSDETPNSRRLNTSSKLNQNSRMKSLGLKSPMRDKRFISPLKPLEIHSPSKELEDKAVTKSLGFASPLKRSENKLSSKPSENNSLNLVENESDSKVKETVSLPKVDHSSTISSSRENCLKSKLKSPPNNLDSKSKEEQSHKNVSLNSPPSSPTIQRIMQSLEYQPVVKLQRLSSDRQNISKQDMAILVKRINDKQRQMVELRVRIPTNRKHNLEEIMASILKWREAFKEALETLRAALIEKNGQHFNTSDVLKLLSIPNRIVHFSEEQNDFIFPKL